MIGICGDNCTFCPRYTATQNGGKTEFEKVKELWVRLGLRDHDFPVQDMACNGCLPENRCAYGELRKCVVGKAIENCGWCDDYPCNLIKASFMKSENLRSYANKVCTHEEMDVLHKAFFSKKEHFDSIHRKYKQKSYRKN